MHLWHKYSKWEKGFDFNDRSFGFDWPRTRMVRTCAKCGWVDTRSVDRARGL